MAAAVKAELYENFTDVDCVFAANPRVVDNPVEIEQMTYREMRELSYAGFAVLHDEALMPVFKAAVPLCIRNTNNPAAPGTMIVAERDHSLRPVTGISADSGFSTLYVSKYLMNREIGFDANCCKYWKTKKSPMNIFHPASITCLSFCAATN